VSSALPHLSPPRPTLRVIRLVWATVLLAAPAAVLDALSVPVETTSVTVARILGVRHAAQGVVEVATWPKWRRAGSFIDAAHSLTAVGLGVWRRVGLIDSGIAAAFALAGWS
jgi:hypothetical protein